uniref:MoaD/ThiS family protein n=1 Tax=Ignisphaera aggregans TaxID=334771 RepID=A0A7J3Z6P3_9CREN
MLFIVRLVFLGHLRGVVGARSLEIQLSSKVKLGEFLRLALGMHPNLHRLVSSDGRISEEEVLVLINGVDINVFANPYTEIDIEDSDEITFVPITHGGLA